MRTVVRSLTDPAGFLTREQFVGSYAGAAYPYWERLFVEIFGRDEAPPPIVVDGALATGKDMFAQLAALRILYEILEYGGPKAFGLAPSETLYVILCGKGATARLDARLRQAHYFCGTWTATKNTLEFGEHLCVIEAPADDPAILGMNVAAYIASDVNEKGVDGERVRMIMRSLWRRTLSRPNRPAIIMATGTGTKNTSRIAQLGAGFGDVIYHSPVLWGVNPGQWSSKTFRVAIYPEGAKPKRTMRTRILAVGEPAAEHKGLKVITVPEDLRKEFESDLRGSLRDMAGEPCLS